MFCFCTGWTTTVKKLHHSIRYLVATSEQKVWGSVIKFIFCNKRAVWFCVSVFYLSIHLSSCLYIYVAVHLSFYLAMFVSMYIQSSPHFSQGLGSETVCKKEKICKYLIAHSKLCGRNFFSVFVQTVIMSFFFLSPTPPIELLEHHVVWLALMHAHTQTHAHNQPPV